MIDREINDGYNTVLDDDAEQFVEAKTFSNGGTLIQGRLFPENNGKLIVSLFDKTGQWARPWIDAGYPVLLYDLSHEGDILSEGDTGSIANIIAEITDLIDEGYELYGVLMAPPCTHYAGSGAHTWKRKDGTPDPWKWDEDDPGVNCTITEKADMLVSSALILVEKFNPTFWVLENPVGRLSTRFPELGRPQYFNPNEFAGWLNPTPDVLIELDRIRAKDGLGLTWEEAVFVQKWNAYTKKTGLWGRFNQPEKKPVEPVFVRYGKEKFAPHFGMTGGKSDRTKDIRSATPLGFAKAFFEANKLDANAEVRLRAGGNIRTSSLIRQFNYPSASSIEYHDGKLLIIGDDAADGLVVDAATLDEIARFHILKNKKGHVRIPKKKKRDLEASAIHDGSLYVFGSASKDRRVKALKINLKNYDVTDISDRYEKLIHKLGKKWDEDIINIEGAAFVHGELVLANRENHALVLTTPAMDGIHRILTVRLDKAVRLSGLCYINATDTLLFTASTEDRDNPIDDGRIGDSYLGWINDFGYRSEKKGDITPDQIVNLSDYDPVLRGNKVESVTSDDQYLYLVADNDDGKTVLIRMALNAKSPLSGDFGHPSSSNHNLWKNESKSQLLNKSGLAANVEDVFENTNENDENIFASGGPLSAKANAQAQRIRILKLKLSLEKKGSAQFINEKYLPDDIPFAIKDAVNAWQHIARSPYGDSFYSSKDKSWTYTEPGSFRVADHWGDDTDKPVAEEHWTLAQFMETSRYYIVPEEEAPQDIKDKYELQKQHDRAGMLKEAFYKIPIQDKSVLAKHNLPERIGNAGAYRVIESLPKISNGYNRYFRALEQERKIAAKAETGRPQVHIAGEELMPVAPQYVEPGRYADAAGFILDDHQTTGINLALHRFHSTTPGSCFILADGTGFGKTAQELAIADRFLNEKKKPVLLITQNKQILKSRFAADAAAMGIDFSQFESGTYDDVRVGKAGSGDYGLVIWDEAHNLKNQDAKKTVEAMKIKTDYSLYATATPFDRPSGASYFLSKLFTQDEDNVRNLLGFKRIKETDDFGKEYFRFVLNEKMTWDRVSRNIANMRDEAIKLGAMVRREYPFWGEITYDRKILTGDDAAEEASIIDYWNHKIAATGNPMVRTNYAGQKVLELSRWLESKKLKDVNALLDEAIRSRSKVIVIAEGINETAIKGLGGSSVIAGEAVEGTVVPGLIGAIEKRLEAEGIGFARIYGNNAKADEVTKFQEDESCLIAIATPKSGGAGIDLDDKTGAHPRTLYIATPNFAGDVFEQILGRVSRKTTQSPATIIFNIYENAFSDLKRAGIVSKKLDALRNIQNGTDLDIAHFDFADEVLRGKSAGEEIIRQRKEAAAVKEQQRQEQLKQVMPELSWKSVTTKAGKKMKVASATKDFWVWWKEHKGDAGRQVWVSKDSYTGDWNVWKEEEEQKAGGGILEIPGGIPERYKAMGFRKVGEKKQSDRPEKKWMVLAKKGDKYKVVHGGYKGMQDYSQHNDKERRERFWERMGGKDSEKAKDVFSPLYWHKKFGTWEDGGEIDFKKEKFDDGGVDKEGYDGGIATTPRLHLANIKMFEGRDGVGMDADLYMDGVNIAHIHDEADGGAYRYTIHDRARFTLFENYVKALPPQYVPQIGMDMQVDTDLFIAVLHHAQETKMGEGGTTYDQRIQRNMEHMGQKLEEWKAVPIIGFQEIPRGKGTIKMPLFKFPEGYAEAPSLYAMSSNTNDANCELCGHTPIAIIYWLQNDLRRQTLRVGSECVTHFEGASGKELARAKRIELAKKLDADLQQFRQAIWNKFRRERDAGYGRKYPDWSTSFIGNANTAIVTDADRADVSELITAERNKTTAQYLGWRHIHDKVMKPFNYDRELMFKNLHKKDAAKENEEATDTALLTWYSRNREKKERALLQALTFLQKQGYTGFEVFKPLAQHLRIEELKKVTGSNRFQKQEGGDLGDDPSPRHHLSETSYGSTPFTPLFDWGIKRGYARGGLLAPNGRPSKLTPEQYRLVRTPAFKAWFGDWENPKQDVSFDDKGRAHISNNHSVVVDENGEPLVVCHGTAANFNVFNESDFSGGIFFTDWEFYCKWRAYDKYRETNNIYNFQSKAETNEEYMKEMHAFLDKHQFGVVKQFFLNIRDPHIIKWSSSQGEPSSNPVMEALWIAAARDKGNDGVIIQAKQASNYIIFSSRDAKLADGTNKYFESGTLDIRYARGGSLRPGMTVVLTKDSEDYFLKEGQELEVVDGKRFGKVGKSMPGRVWVRDPKNSGTYFTMPADILTAKVEATPPPAATMAELVEQRLQEAQKNKEYKDVGRKRGTRKEAAAYAFITSHNIQELEEADAVMAERLVTKARVWPEVNIEEEKQSGTSAGACFLKVQYHRALSAKPLNTAKARDAYVRVIEVFKDTLAKAKTVKEVMEVGEATFSRSNLEKMGVGRERSISREMLWDDTTGHAYEFSIAYAIDKGILSKEQFEQAKALIKKFNDTSGQFRKEYGHLPFHELEGKGIGHYYSQGFTYYGKDLTEEKREELEKIEEEITALERQISEYNNDMENIPDVSIMHSRNRPRISITAKIKEYKYDEDLANAIFGKPFLNLVDGNTYASASVSNKIYYAKKYEAIPLEREEEWKREIQERSSRGIREMEEQKADLITQHYTDLVGFIRQWGFENMTTEHFQQAFTTDAERDEAARTLATQIWDDQIRKRKEADARRMELIPENYKARPDDWSWAYAKKPTSGDGGPGDDKPRIHQGEYLSHIRRKGGISVSKIGVADVKERWGLHAVQFGNTLTDKQSEALTFFLNGSFSDLEEVTGISLPKIHNMGELGIDFATRGISGSAATYWADYHVINLNKRNGDGSLGHEWGHFFDNFLTSKAVREEDKVKINGHLGVFASTHGAADPAVAAIMNELFHFIRHGDGTEVVKKKIKGVPHGYSGPKDYVASHQVLPMDEWIESVKAAIAHNKSVLHGIGVWRYNYKAETGEYKTLEANINHTDEELKKIYEEWVQIQRPTFNKMLAHFQRVYPGNFRSPKKAQQYMETIAYALVGNNELEYDAKLNSSYYYHYSSEMNSGKSKSSGYWVEYPELFARAWEKYLFWKLNQKEFVNTFLQPPKPWFEKYHVYPEGKELEKINAMIDRLVAKTIEVYDLKSTADFTGPRVDEEIQNTTLDGDKNLEPSLVEKQEEGEVETNVPPCADDTCEVPLPAPKTFYHGTAAAPFKQFQTEVAYLAKDRDETEIFALNQMVGGGSDGIPRIITVQAPSGKSKDIRQPVLDFIMSDFQKGNLDDLILAEADTARKEGYDYLVFDHPGSGSTDFEATVSLHPERLIIIGEQPIQTRTPEREPAAAGGTDSTSVAAVGNKYRVRQTLTEGRTGKPKHFDEVVTITEVKANGWISYKTDDGNLGGMSEKAFQRGLEDGSITEQARLSMEDRIGKCFKVKFPHKTTTDLHTYKLRRQTPTGYILERQIVKETMDEYQLAPEEFLQEFEVEDQWFDEALTGRHVVWLDSCVESLQVESDTSATAKAKAQAQRIRILKIKLGLGKQQQPKTLTYDEAYRYILKYPPWHSAENAKRYYLVSDNSKDDHMRIVPEDVVSGDINYDEFKKKVNTLDIIRYADFKKAKAAVGKLLPLAAAAPGKITLSKDTIIKMMQQRFNDDRFANSFSFYTDARQLYMAKPQDQKWKSFGIYKAKPGAEDVSESMARGMGMSSVWEQKPFKVFNTLPELADFILKTSAAELQKQVKAGGGLFGDEGVVEWKRVDGHPIYKHLGARYFLFVDGHETGYYVEHCGHQTALFPYTWTGPDGKMQVAPNGKGFQRLEMAKEAVMLHRQGKEFEYRPEHFNLKKGKSTFSKSDVEQLLRQSHKKAAGGLLQGQRAAVIATNDFLKTKKLYLVTIAEVRTTGPRDQYQSQVYKLEGFDVELRKGDSDAPPYWSKGHVKWRLLPLERAEAYYKAIPYRELQGEVREDGGELDGNTPLQVKDEQQAGFYRTISHPTQEAAQWLLDHGFVLNHVKMPLHHVEGYSLSNTLYYIAGDGTRHDRPVVIVVGRDVAEALLPQTELVRTEKYFTVYAKQMAAGGSLHAHAQSPFIRIPVNDLQINLSEFQGRATPYATQTHNRIINEAAAGTLNLSAIPPIQIWQERVPVGGQPKTKYEHWLKKAWDESRPFVILAGHSRTAAFKDLAAGKFPLHSRYQPQDFKEISAQVVSAASLDEARKIAQESNAGAVQTDLENAAYIRSLRTSGKNTKAQLHDKCTDLYGKNCTYIEELSYLNPTGKVVNMLTQLQHMSDKSQSDTIAKIASFIGSARNRLPQLTDAHENELYDWLTRNVTNPKTDTKTEFLSLIGSRVNRLDFDATQPLNLDNVATTTSIEDSHNQQINDLEQLIRDKQKEMGDKRLRLQQAGLGNDKIEEMTDNEDKYIIRLQGQLIALKQKDIAKAAKTELGLFDNPVNALNDDDELPKAAPDTPTPYLPPSRAATNLPQQQIEEQAVYGAIHSFEDADQRWRVLVHSGKTTDADILKQLDHELSGPGGFSFGSGSVDYKGGQHPEVKISGGYEKTLKGKELLAIVRKIIMGKPAPDPEPTGIKLSKYWYGEKARVTHGPGTPDRPGVGEIVMINATIAHLADKPKETRYTSSAMAVIRKIDEATNTITAQLLSNTRIYQGAYINQGVYYGDTVTFPSDQMQWYIPGVTDGKPITEPEWIAKMQVLNARWIDDLQKKVAAIQGEITAAAAKKHKTDKLRVLLKSTQKELDELVKRQQSFPSSASAKAKAQAQRIRILQLKAQLQATSITPSSTTEQMWRAVERANKTGTLEWNGEQYRIGDQFTSAMSRVITIGYFKMRPIKSWERTQRKRVDGKWKDVVVHTNTHTIAAVVGYNTHGTKGTKKEEVFSEDDIDIDNISSAAHKTGEDSSVKGWTKTGYKPGFKRTDLPKFEKGAVI